MDWWEDREIMYCKEVNKDAKKKYAEKRDKWINGRTEREWKLMCDG